MVVLFFECVSCDVNWQLQAKKQENSKTEKLLSRVFVLD